MVHLVHHMLHVGCNAHIGKVLALVELLDECLGIRDNLALFGFHDFHELGSLHRQHFGIFLGGEQALVDPLGPKELLAKPISRIHLRGLFPIIELAMVCELPGDQQEHAGIARGLEGAEEAVGLEQSDLRHGGVADLPHRRGVLVAEPAEEGMRLQQGLEHFEVELLEEGLGHQLQCLDVGLGRNGGLCLQGVLRISLQAVGQALGDALGLQVPRQGLQLTGLLVRHHGDLSHQ
mmetsp:Transcript_149785/g.481079  ORF Transcript_149785/g.481079 Transcript_149785/m.481079 type:complete len:234 (+) Transcript_149785:481-1182(+)